MTGLQVISFEVNKLSLICSRMPVRVRKHPLMAEAVSNKKRIEELYKMVTKGRRRPSMLDELR